MGQEFHSNLLLAGLSADAFQRVTSELTPIEMAQGRAILPVSGKLDNFYFISDGLVSLIHETSEGESAEIALVGCEGGVGLPLVLGGHPFPVQTVVQMPVTGWSLPASALYREFRRDPSSRLRSNILHYTQALMTQMAHTVVCNRHHSVELQLVRWILLSLDRLPTSELTMTQEMIAHMLGVRRAGVSEAIGRLNDRGVLEHARGRIWVLDRDTLEATACECYHTIKSEYDLLEQKLLNAGSTEVSA